MVSRLAGAVIAAVLAGTFGLAGEAKGEGKEERQKFREEQKEKRQEQREKQKEENKEFRESQQGKTAQEKAAAAASHLDEQFSENQEFCAQQYARLVEFAKQRMAEKGVKEEKQTEVLAWFRKRFDEVAAHRAEQHKENVDLLQELAGKSGLTQEELKATLKAHRETQKAENKEFREKLKEEPRPKAKRDGAAKAE